MSGKYPSEVWYCYSKNRADARDLYTVNIPNISTSSKWNCKFADASLEVEGSYKGLSSQG